MHNFLDVFCVDVSTGRDVYGWEGRDMGGI